MVSLVKYLWHFFKNKYFLATLFFLFWLILFDQNNWVDRVRMIKKKRQMEESIKYYQEKIREDKKRLQELQTDRENLEKFAREQYYMKRDNEDIFILEE
ncbi:MAG: septum formation initiator family protein [Bacteroidales bacterium]|nr:septum formation initiator family protein [Bacteroidales bacterium]